MSDMNYFNISFGTPYISKGFQRLESDIDSSKNKHEKGNPLPPPPLA